MNYQIDRQFFADATAARVSRRSFLKVSALAGGGLLIGLQLTPKVSAAAATTTGGTFVPNAFLRIAPNGAITILAKHSEMGQGIYTSMAMCVAEELDADWSKIAVEAAPSAQAYAHTAFGLQMTGGSTSTPESYKQLREAGATARALLVQAAAQQWKVDAVTLRTDNGAVIAADGRRATYGELATAASALPAPTEVKLKDPSQFKLIGKAAHRVDSLEKITGKGVFGIDVRVPDMLIAALVRPPVFGAKLKRFDATAAKAVSGVKNVVATPRGVAVIAANTWAAKQGAAALTVEWDEGALATLSTENQRAAYEALIKQPGAVAKRTGDVATAFASATTKIEATFDFPYLAHAAMEPLNATAHIKPDGSVEVWAPTQFQGVDVMVAAQVAGVTPDKVTLHTTLLGGGFGRKANPASDFIAEAVEVAKVSGGVPVQVVWSREDDMRGGYYRPRTLVHAKLGLDAAGKPVSWENQIASQSLIKGTAFEQAMFRNGLDATQVEGLDEIPYALPNAHTEWHDAPAGVPVLWWRSVGHTFTGFVKETLIDDAARAAKKDPIDYRIELLAAHPRQVAILQLLKEKSNWGRAPAGRFQGVAIHESFGSIVGEVAEVSVTDGVIKVHKVTAVADCGQAVNPDGVRAQVMSAVIYGLSATLYGEITFKDGRPQQSNFHDYPVVRLTEAPVVETHIINSGAAMGGIGEPGTPPLMPAVSNAVLAATGKRLRHPPFTPDKLA